MTIPVAPGGTMDLAQLRAVIGQSLARFERDDVLKLSTMTRVGYWVTRYSCGWTRDMPGPSTELLDLLNQAGVPSAPNPHIRLLYFAAHEAARASALNGIPRQRQAPSIEAKWYYDLADELDQ